MKYIFYRKCPYIYFRHKKIQLNFITCLSAMLHIYGDGRYKKGTDVTVFDINEYNTYYIIKNNIETSLWM